MTATLQTARDEILGAFKTRWDLDSAAVNGGTIPPVAYEGVPFAAPSTAAWARIVVRHASGGQATLAGDVPSRIRTRKIGVVIVSVFAPLEKGLGVTLGRNLAAVAKKAFEGAATPSAVWFRNAVAAEVGEDGPWFQWNVSATFEYDEFPS